MRLQIMRIHTNRSLCVRQASDESDLTMMSNVLDLVDQTVFLGERATGATCLGQFVWVYDRAIDIDGVRQFHHHLQRGRLSRRIERSSLPFGRPAIRPTSRSSGRLGRVKNSTPG
jgi:hypothetical protein